MLKKEHIAGFLFMVAFGIHAITWIISISLVVMDIFSFGRFQIIISNFKYDMYAAWFGSAVVMLLAMRYLKDKNKSDDNIEHE